MNGNVDKEILLLTVRAQLEEQTRLHKDIVRRSESEG